MRLPYILRNVSFRKQVAPYDKGPSIKSGTGGNLGTNKHTIRK